MTQPSVDGGGTERDRLHQHLDGCEQCRNHPFDMCPTGGILLARAAEEASAVLRLAMERGLR